jgi:ATP-dependent protease ClpP protease subunit
MTEEKPHEPQFIKIHSNEIFFYSEVSVESVQEFNFHLSKLDVDLRQQYVSLGIDERPTIKIYIHSPGGDVHAGFAAMDHIRSCKSKTVTIADGFTASAAAMMYLGGQERLIKENAFILIHQLSSEFWGTYGEMRAEVSNLDKLMDRMRYVCKKYTTIPEHHLETLMQKDVILPAKKCIKYGISSRISI